MQDLLAPQHPEHRIIRCVLHLQGKSTGVVGLAQSDLRLVDAEIVQLFVYWWFLVSQQFGSCRRWTVFARTSSGQLAASVAWGPCRLPADICAILICVCLRVSVQIARLVKNCFGTEGFVQVLLTSRSLFNFSLTDRDPANGT